MIPAEPYDQIWTRQSLGYHRDQVSSHRGKVGYRGKGKHGRKAVARATYPRGEQRKPQRAQGAVPEQHTEQADQHGHVVLSSDTFLGLDR